MTTTTRWAGVAAAGALALLAPGRAACQETPAGTATAEPAQACTSRTVGSLGLTGLDCRGDCTLTLDKNLGEQAWSFSVEPRITGLQAGGPSDGILQVGDVIVAVDGLLITTAEGGERLANLRPEVDVTVRYRRGARLAEALVHTESVCGRAWDVPEPPPPPPPPGSAAPAPRVVAPRVRVTGAAPVPAAAPVPWVAKVLPQPGTPPRAPSPPRARLGLAFTCSECGTRTDSASGGDVWFFSRAPEVTAVDAGGAADRAGIQIGDRIVAVGGAGITTDAGGRAFGAVRPGVAVRITVAKRNGREDTVTLVPEAREAAVVTLPTAAPEPAAVPAPPGAPKSAVPPAPPPPPDPTDTPAGLPLRYSGTLAGVEVEVRGAPVMVSSDAQGTRTMVIWTDGLWIRIRVPAPEGR